MPPNLFAFCWFVFLFFAVLLKVCSRLDRPTALTIWGLAVFFFAAPLALPFSLVLGMESPAGIMEGWQFSFRSLGIGLFVWGLFDALARSIQSVGSALSSQPEHVD